jgi:hypothetical protein
MEEQQRQTGERNREAGGQRMDSRQYTTLSKRHTGSKREETQQEAAA